MNTFAVSIVGAKGTLISHGVALIEAVSEAEALGLAQKLAERMFPSSEGYTFRTWKVADFYVDPLECVREITHDPSIF